ncbi:helix-turn-helix domain-containing protein [Chryseobacterium sp.]|uniref:AraC family transcriptional regulator n=1 Tax=Chryseobacterium sp. TaxID=1871047 RepID=UPI002899D8E4|nr:helix-turn-helix domain-containing protein [Chryseobacterium sp.]
MMNSGKPIPVHNLSYQDFQLTTLENGCAENFNDIHRHNFYEIIWFLETQKDSSLELDFEKYDLIDNQICILAPGQVFNMKLQGERGYVFAISKEIFQEICDVEMVLIDGIKPFQLPLKVKNTCESLVALMEKEYHDEYRMNLLTSYLKSFCIVITGELLSQENISGDKQRIQELIKLIEGHYLVEKETPFYAEKLNISSHHLNDIVRLGRGTTVKKMIAQRLLLEAKRELSFGTCTVKEIAFKLGFNDASYFSRFFKKHIGKSPESFKSEK